MAAQRSAPAKTKKVSPKKSAIKPKKSVAKPAKAKKAVVREVRAAVAVKAAKPVVKAAVSKKPEPAVAVNGSVSKKAAVVVRLNKADIEHFRDLLLEKRREILGDVGSMESEAFKLGSNLSNMPIHMADVGTDNFEQEFTLGLIESERQILREIQEALLRLESGTFGICVATGKPIAKARLEAIPWTKYTMDHARALEQGLVRRDPNQADDETEADDDEE